MLVFILTKQVFDQTCSSLLEGDNDINKKMETGLFF